MRRKAGTLLPIEVAILESAIALRAQGQDAFHGFMMATELSAQGGRSLTSHGTLYKALGRLEDMGLLRSAWEDAALAEEAGRPRRRLYGLTGAAEQALAGHHRAGGAATVDGRAAWGVP